MTLEAAKPAAMADVANMTDSSGEVRPQGGTRQLPLRGWLITDGKAGMDVQVRAVAEALGLDYEMKRVSPRGVWAMAAPWGPVAPVERFGQPGTLFAPPWPDIAIATGRASIPYVRALRKASSAAVFTVVLQDPKTGPSTADLIWVPEHDRRRGANVITTLTAPHSFSVDRFTTLRRETPAEIAALPGPRITVVLGGKNGVYTFSEADDRRLEASLSAFGALGGSFLVTPSRRTHQRLIRAVERATDGRPRLIWDGRGDNPYPQFLANADVLVVTADSVNMCGEACATGKPVYVFTPSGGSPKFTRFHDAL
ncbi:MAG: mitochondrial fission ELM1 family protein, partial [Hyphomicrobiaceae bacterium]|nr:mitochondrial fission ELM1 family protein [Hyphomicrobiaceae bacterium]